MILFVCTGNTCRSAMAHVLARSVFDSEGISEEIYSCGTAAFCGAGASNGAMDAVEAYGCSLDEHSASTLNDELVESARLILTMTVGHKNYVQSRFVQSQGKLYTLKGFLHGVDSDIADPYGGNIDVYKRCAEEIFNCVTTLAEIIKRR